MPRTHCDCGCQRPLPPGRTRWATDECCRSYHKLAATLRRAMRRGDRGKTKAHGAGCSLEDVE